MSIHLTNLTKGILFIMLPAAIAAAVGLLSCEMPNKPVKPLYRITALDIGGWAINDASQVVGTLEVEGDAFHASMWEDGRGAVDLGTLGGRYSRAERINNLSHVVGDASIRSDKAQRPFLWSKNQGMVDLGTLGGTNGEALGINDKGQVVGDAQIAGDIAFHAFLWERTSGMADLGTLGGTLSSASAINNAGQVVGNSKIAGEKAAPFFLQASHAFLWQRGSGMIDLGTLGGKDSDARSINELGQVVGESKIAGDNESHAFLWEKSLGMIDLGTLGGKVSYARAVSNSGQVVGTSEMPGDKARHGFLWEKGLGMLDLNTLIDPNDPLFGKVTLQNVRGINAKGQIVVDCVFSFPAKSNSVLLSLAPGRLR